jgi:hypothetical protein
MQGVVKKYRTFAIKTLLFILKHFKHCPIQTSLLYWRYTVPHVSSIVGIIPGTHFLWRQNFTHVVLKTLLLSLRRTACARAQFSGCSSTTNAHSETGQMGVCCQNLTLGVPVAAARSLCWLARYLKVRSLFEHPSYATFRDVLDVFIKRGIWRGMFWLRSVPVLSDVVVTFLSSVVVLIADGQFWIVPLFHSYIVFLHAAFTTAMLALISCVHLVSFVIMLHK